jgi:hypothetical protein
MTDEVKIKKAKGDSDDILYKGKWIGFKSKSGGTLGLRKCPECGRENYAMAVLGGVCVWCGFDIKTLFE